MAIHTFGSNAVDWEERVDLVRLRSERLARLRAARHHQLYNPWLDHTAGPATPDGAARTGARAGISTLRGAFHPQAGIAEEVARQVAAELREHGVADAPLGIDVAEMPVLAALRAEGIETVDGQQVFLEARRTKTADEISLLSQACAMVDAAYTELYEFLRPGVRENECVRSSTSCTATWATGPATTARSPWAAPRARSATPTCAAVSTWTPRSRW